MNWLDILMLIVCLIIFIGGLVILVLCVKDDETPFGVGVFLGAIGLAIFIGAYAWLSTDFKSGQTVGEITSVDKNFFGTTAVYIKTTNNQEEKYCVEDEKVAESANRLVGYRVKITYGKRVGLYSTGKCDDAPIDSIEVVE